MRSVGGDGEIGRRGWGLEGGGEDWKEGVKERGVTRITSYLNLLLFCYS